MCTLYFVDTKLKRERGGKGDSFLPENEYTILNYYFISHLLKKEKKRKEFTYNPSVILIGTANTLNK